MCAYICACAHSWLQVWVHTWRSEDNPKCPSSLSTLFKSCSLGCRLLWSMGLWDCPDSTFHLPIRVLELQPWELPCQLYMGSGESNSSPRMCVASAPAPESPLKLPIYFIDFFETIINEIVVWISFSDSILSMFPVFEYHKPSYYKYLYINFWVNICFHFSRVNTQKYND